MKRSSTFYRALWTIKVNFLDKKLGAVALNYLLIQEINPWGLFLVQKNENEHCHVAVAPNFFAPFEVK
jgi:hypothetical protein